MDHIEMLEAVLDHPEAVLQKLGTDGAITLLHSLSEDPAVEAVIKDSELVKMIESGKKYVIGTIETEG